MHTVKAQDTEDWYSFLCNNNINERTRATLEFRSKVTLLLCYRRERQAILLGIPVENVADGSKEAGERGGIKCSDFEFRLGRVGAHSGADGRSAGFSVQEGEF